MNDRRVERLTREALGPAQRVPYSRLDDAGLRAAGIVVLIVTVVVIASWPRGEEPRRSAKTSATRVSAIVPAAARSSDTAAATHTAQYTPLY